MEPARALAGGERGRRHADGDSARAPGSAEKAKDPGRARGAESDEAARNTERTLPRARANDGAGVAGGGQTAGAAELPGGVAPNSECGVAAEAATPRSEPPPGQQRLKGGCTGPEVPSRARRRSPAQPAARRLKQRQGRRPQAMYLGKGCILPAQANHGLKFGHFSAREYDLPVHVRAIELTPLFSVMITKKHYFYQPPPL